MSSGKGKTYFQAILTIIVWSIFLISLLRMCVVYNTLPDQIGVHFAADGSFDLIADKKFAWYPYVLLNIILLICELLGFWIGKIKTGLKISKKGEAQIRNAVHVFLNVFKTGAVIFFSGIWADCVIKQQKLNTTIAGGISIIFLLSIIAFLTAVVVIRLKESRKE